MTQFDDYPDIPAHHRALPVRIGGLMRCCLKTLDETPVREQEGDVLPCKWCGSLMRVCKGVWKWDHA